MRVFRVHQRAIGVAAAWLLVAQALIAGHMPMPRANTVLGENTICSAHVHAGMQGHPPGHSQHRPQCPCCLLGCLSGCAGGAVAVPVAIPSIAVVVVAAGAAILRRPDTRLLTTSGCRRPTTPELPRPASPSSTRSAARAGQPARTLRVIRRVGWSSELRWVEGFMFRVVRVAAASGAALTYLLATTVHLPTMPAASAMPRAPARSTRFPPPLWRKATALPASPSTTPTSTRSAMRHFLKRRRPASRMCTGWTHPELRPELQLRHHSRPDALGAAALGAAHRHPRGAARARR